MERTIGPRISARLSLKTLLAAALVLAVGFACSPQQSNARATARDNKEQVVPAEDWASHCTSLTQLPGLNGQPDIRLSQTLGTPNRKETFLLGERQGEFHVTLQNHYPLTVAANAKVELQEWTWESGTCRLTVWLHKPDTTWIAFENMKYPATAEF
jgi:hypothetical protein